MTKIPKPIPKPNNPLIPDKYEFLEVAQKSVSTNGDLNPFLIFTYVTEAINSSRTLTAEDKAISRAYDTA